MGANFSKNIFDAFRNIEHEMGGAHQIALHELESKARQLTGLDADYKLVGVSDTAVKL